MIGALINLAMIWLWLLLAAFDVVALSDVGYAIGINGVAALMCVLLDGMGRR